MTMRAYAPTVGELLDGRARKKARTREHIRGIAHRLFAEHGFDAVPVADVAREADVAVQTVFNHFATKEELFFDGRMTWIEGPARAVRSRAPGEQPLPALRAYLVELGGSLVGSLADEERRRYVATVEASQTLRAQEREYVFEAERLLAVALVEAWDDGAAPRPADPATAAALTAAVWLSSLRVLVIGQRPRLSSGACPGELAAAVESVAAALLAQLETTAALTRGALGARVPDRTGTTDTGWPETTWRAG
jgi:AcrR family transcriptional regulator